MGAGASKQAAKATSNRAAAAAQKPLPQRAAAAGPPPAQAASPKASETKSDGAPGTVPLCTELVIEQTDLAITTDCSDPKGIRRPRLCTQTRRSRTGQSADAWVGVHAPTGEQELRAVAYGERI